MSHEIVLNDAKKYIKNNILQQSKAVATNKNCSVVFLSGPPGIGKSDLLTQIANELGCGLNVQYLGTMLPEQFGLPMSSSTDGFQNWSTPEFYSVKNLRVNIDKSQTVILFLDDLHLATKTIQTYFFQLLTYRSIHNKKMPDNFVMVAAGNRSQDRAGAQAILAPIVNRFYFLDVKSSAKDWIDNFAISYGVRDDIVTFINRYPELLESTPLESTPWASPRSWTYLSDEINQLETTEKVFVKDLLQIAKGHIGLEYASKFIEYVELFQKWDSKKMLSKDIPLPDIQHLSMMDSYSLMSALISEYMKNMRDADYNLGPDQVEQTNLIKEMFNQLQISAKEIIPLGMRTIILGESVKSKTSRIYALLIQNNPMLLETVKTIIGLNKQQGETG